MALNTIEYASKLQTGLDKKAVIDATSGWMDENAGQVIIPVARVSRSRQ